MFEFFKRLFGKKQPMIAADALKIEFNENGIFIGENRVEIPSHISGLERILGKPRAVKYKTSEKDREFLEAMHGKGLASERVNYAWDELGLYCYTFGGMISCFAVLFESRLNLKHEPHKPFSGKVTINCRPWIETVLTGEDAEVMMRVKAGEYLITAEFLDFDQDPGTRNEKSFTGLEIQLD